MKEIVRTVAMLTNGSNDPRQSLMTSTSVNVITYANSSARKRCFGVAILRLGTKAYPRIPSSRITSAANLGNEICSLED